MILPPAKIHYTPTYKQVTVLCRLMEYLFPHQRNRLPDRLLETIQGSVVKQKPLVKFESDSGYKLPIKSRDARIPAHQPPSHISWMNK